MNAKSLMKHHGTKKMISIVTPKLGKYYTFRLKSYKKS